MLYMCCCYPCIFCCWFALFLLSYTGVFFAVVYQWYNSFIFITFKIFVPFVILMWYIEVTRNKIIEINTPYSNVSLELRKKQIILNYCNEAIIFTPPIVLYIAYVIFSSTIMLWIANMSTIGLFVLCSNYPAFITSNALKTSINSRRHNNYELTSGVACALISFMLIYDIFGVHIIHF